MGPFCGEGSAFNAHHMILFAEILLAQVADAKNPRLKVDCIASVLRMPLANGLSQSDIARKHGVTRATVSKSCVDLRRSFGIDTE